MKRHETTKVLMPHMATLTRSDARWDGTTTSKVRAEWADLLDGRCAGGDDCACDWCIDSDEAAWRAVVAGMSSQRRAARIERKASRLEEVSGRVRDFATYTLAPAIVSGLVMAGLAFGGAIVGRIVAVWLV